MTNMKERDLTDVLRDEMVMHDRILDFLRKEPGTIPEIARALDRPGWEVTIWVMAMMRYGLLSEMPKGRADDYYRYTPAE
ncbi:MAG: MarR family transcriptional regulator [Deltaproteobacteria bacterium]|nr:MAG: MarR family transcriptional regulator [Deltaproteobacteria bacterium]